MADGCGPTPNFQLAYDPTNPAGTRHHPGARPIPNTPIRSFGTAALATPNNAYFLTSNVPGLNGVSSTPLGPCRAGRWGCRRLFDTEFNPDTRSATGTVAEDLEQPDHDDGHVRRVHDGRFFEVTNSPNNQVGAAAIRPALGKELFKDMPGDLRQRYLRRHRPDEPEPDPANLRLQGGKPFVTETVTPLTANSSRYDSHHSCPQHGGQRCPPVELRRPKLQYRADGCP